ncbi:NPCBM/NEW2 domain-containing protein [Paenibacillus medicaginis]|uniref:NPCBM/NEW2 domain-containing protein n=1 Tax=Paenibacillus medicaginis TaxID=1470560 RepID=A0ABV5C8V3_9BACL
MRFLLQGNKVIYGGFIFFLILLVVPFFIQDNVFKNLLFLAYFDGIIFAMFLLVIFKLNYIHRNEVILYSLSFVALSLFGVLIINYIYSIEHTIYFSDNAFYWQKSKVFYESLDQNFIHVMYNVYLSILHNDYNDLVLLFLSPWIGVFGFGYKGYILSVFFAFLLPAFFFFVVLSSNLIRELKENKTHIGLPILAASFIVYSFSGVVHPSLIGYLDVVGLIPIMMLYLLVYKKRVNNFNVWDIILAIILLISLAFLRRWYAYFVVSFFAAIFITNFLRVIWDKNFKWKDFFLGAVKLAIIGLGCLTVLFIFFKPFIILSTRDIGKGVYEYNNSPVLEKIIETSNVLGLITVLLVLAGCVIGIIFKQSRYFAIFSILQSLIAYLLITSEQGLSPQHIMLLSTGLMILVFLNFNYMSWLKCILEKKTKVNSKSVLTLVLIFCFALSSLFIYNGYFKDIQTAVGPMTVLSKHNEPRVNKDIDQIKEITNYLNSLSSSDKTVYVISGECCYDDVFNNLYLPEKTNALNNLIRSAYNDALGFPNRLLSSGYVVVVSPIVSKQLAVEKTAEYFTEGRFGNYHLIKEVNLNSGHNVKIFERRGPFTASSLKALNDLQGEYYKRYPDKKEYYTFADYRVNITDAYSGLSGFEVGLTPEKIILHPGEADDNESISYIEINAEKAFKKLSFTAAMGTTDQNIAPVEGVAEVYVSVLGDGTLIDKKYITINHPHSFNVDIAKYKNVKVQVDKGKYSNNTDTTELTNVKID